jgi:hypothetical protein
MLLGVGAIQYVARTDREEAYELRSPTGEYVLRVYRDMPIPAIFGDRGRAPGLVEVSDTAGRVFAAEHVPDVDSVGEFQWERYKVDFRYVDETRSFGRP